MALRVNCVGITTAAKFDGMGHKDWQARKEAATARAGVLLRFLLRERKTRTLGIE